MDISILSGTVIAGTQPRDSSPGPSASTEGSFARRLEQAVAQGDRAKPATASDPSPRPSNAAPAARPADEVAAVTPGTAESPELTPALHTPAAVGTGAPLDSLAAMSTPQPQVDPLDEIRQRLALIEQAGRLPTDAAGATAAATFATPPTQATTPATITAQAADSRSNAPLDGLSNLAARHPEATRGDSDQHNQPALQAAAAALESNTAAKTNATSGGDAEPAQLESSFSMLPRGEAPPAALFAANSGTLTPATTASLSSPPLATLAAPLGSREWQQGLGQQLLGLHQRGEQHIELHLHPSDLGPLSVSLKLSELGAQAQFLSAHPQVRAAIEQAIPQLREALAAQGISLGETSVGEQHQPPQDQQAGNGSRTLASTTPGESADSVPPPSLAVQPLALGQVDLYA